MKNRAALGVIAAALTSCSTPASHVAPRQVDASASRQEASHQGKGRVSEGQPASGNERPGRRGNTEYDFEARLRAMGAPIAFDDVFAEVQRIPRFKDEFETSAQFAERQASARAVCASHFLIEVQVDPEHVKYDADEQTLAIATYALTNTLATSDELSSVFGYGSELDERSIKIEYDLLFSNVMWTLPREKADVGTYPGSNAFGATVAITKQEGVTRAVFEREGKHDEDVWTNKRVSSVEGSAPVAFAIKADPEKAKALKQGGLRAAILVAPMAPYYAVGVDRFSPTIRAPYDRTTEVRFIIGDIQCAAIYDASGELVATRATR